MSKGYSVEQTADLLGYSIEFVETTKKEADLKKAILSLLKEEKNISFIANKLAVDETYILEIENELNQKKENI